MNIIEKNSKIENKDGVFVGIITDINLKDKRCLILFNNKNIERWYSIQKVKQFIFDIPDYILDDSFKEIKIKSKTYYYKNYNFYSLKENKFLFMMSTQKDAKGYHVVLSNRKHRLIYCAEHGIELDTISGKQIDHIDCNKDNNLISNLKLCGDCENQKNKTKSSVKIYEFYDTVKNKYIYTNSVRKFCKEYDTNCNSSGIAHHFGTDKDVSDGQRVSYKKYHIKRFSNTKNKELNKNEYYIIEVDKKYKI